MLNHHDMESSSENDTDLLDVADDVRRRRRKLSHTGKVSGSEFFKVVFKVDGHEWEDLVPATRGICLQEAISCACERRGVEVDCIDVFLDNNNTPLPFLLVQFCITKRFRPSELQSNASYYMSISYQHSACRASLDYNSVR